MTRIHVSPTDFNPALRPMDRTWASLWSKIQGKLRAMGYRPGTLRVYRAALRGLACSSRQTPDRIERRHLDFYLRRLTRNQCSASWVGMNLSILRTVFDKCYRKGLLNGRTGPRRAQSLPHILSTAEAGRLLAAAASPRDAFLLSLLYGCGLRPGEAIALRWSDFDPESREVVVNGRRIPLPVGLYALVDAGRERCDPSFHVFAGRKPDTHLGLRAVSALIRRLAREADMHGPISAMTLRHSFAAHQLQAGMNVRELQEQLGHTSVETTLRYCALDPPPVESPLDRTPAGDQRGSGEAPGVHPHTLLPMIPVSDSVPPFPVEQPGRYFLAWLKRVWSNRRRPRRSG